MSALPPLPYAEWSETKDTLHLFLQIGWGRAYGSLSRDTERVSRSFRLADQLVGAVEEANTSDWPGPLVVVDDFGIAYWMKPGESQGPRTSAS